MSEEQVQLTQKNNKSREQEMYAGACTHRFHSVTFGKISCRKCLSFILQNKLSCMFRDYRQHVIKRMIDTARSQVWESMQETAASSLRRQFLFYSAGGQYFTSSDTAWWEIEQS